MSDATVVASFAATTSADETQPSMTTQQSESCVHATGSTAYCLASARFSVAWTAESSLPPQPDKSELRTTKARSEARGMVTSESMFRILHCCRRELFPLSAIQRLMVPSMRRWLVAALIAAPAGCAAAPPPPAVPPPVASAPQPPAVSPESVFREILALRPLVLAIGEGHAQKGTEGVPSATRRFTESLLPMLAGRASDIVIELWMQDSRCKREVERVREQQKPVVEQQARTNKNEMLILAEEAKKLGIVPWPLRPTCEEYDAVSKAGDDAIPAMLELTAKMASRTIEACLRRNAQNGSDKIVVSYGGAMHNDLAPATGREAWSFGPRMKELAQGRYVELDLFVPESIGDTESWRKLAWYPLFDRTRPHADTTAFHPSATQWVVIFPTTAR
jgi:hypothetical protein